MDGFGVLHLGRRRFLIPVDVIIFIDARNVHIDQTSGRIAEAEAVVSDPALAVVPGPTYWEGMYRWYGYPPYWARGYSYWRRYD